MTPATLPHHAMASDLGGTMMTAAEIEAITGLTTPAHQARKLRELGWWLATVSRAGRVLLPRAHYLAVCGGAVRQQPAEQTQPHQAQPAEPAPRVRVVRR